MEAIRVGDMMTTTLVSLKFMKDLARDAATRVVEDMEVTRVAEDMEVTRVAEDMEVTRVVAMEATKAVGTKAT